MGRPSTLTGWWRDLLKELGSEEGLAQLSKALKCNPRTINRWSKGELVMRAKHRQIITNIASPELVNRHDSPLLPDLVSSKSVSNGNRKDDEVIEDIDFDEGTPDYQSNYSPDRKIFTQRTEFSIEYLHKLVKRGRLNLQPEFQRRYVWDIVKASSLIESILLDVPIPVIYLAEDQDGALLVVDGQQRLNSVFSFIDGQFPGIKTFNLSGLTVLRDLNGKNFQQILPDLQEKIETSSLPTVIIKKESDIELKFEVFERLNTGSVALNDQELRNCLFRGSYLNLAKELASDTDFRYIMGFKESDKRMRDVEYVLRFGAFYHQTYLNYPRTMKNYINQEIMINANISDEKMEEFRATFKRAVQINKSMFGTRSFRKIVRGNAMDPNAIWKSSRVVNGALYDLMMVSFLKYDKNLIYRNMDAIREAYFWLLTEDNEFIDAVEKWTNNSNQMRIRFETFNRVIGEILAHDSPQARCFSKEVKEALFKMNDRCGLCGQRILMVEDAAVDHIEQYWLGGRTIPENARITHRYCNQARKRSDGR